MLAQSNTPYILLACTIFDVGTVTHTPYILLACHSHTHLIFC